MWLTVVGDTVSSTQYLLFLLLYDNNLYNFCEKNRVQVSAHFAKANKTSTIDCSWSALFLSISIFSSSLKYEKQNVASHMVHLNVTEYVIGNVCRCFIRRKKIVFFLTTCIITGKIGFVTDFIFKYSTEN